MSGSEAASGDPGDASPEPSDPDVSEPPVLALVVGGLEPAIVEMSAAGSFGPATAMMLPADDQHPACDPAHPKMTLGVRWIAPLILDPPVGFRGACGFGGVG